MDAASSLDDSFHIESHESLLQRPTHTRGSLRQLDAIVVPTIRPRSLQAAVALAKGADCALAVLCSTEEQAGQALAACEGMPGALLITPVPASIEEDWMPFLTSEHPENDVVPSCHADIARKRNTGLLLSRLCGWRTVMYLDDDIRGIKPVAVRRAADLVGAFQVVGFQIDDYPDNSVVCHAHRLAGRNQDVFPGGCAMLLDVNEYDSFFPPIYNEDWLFLFNAVQSHAVAVAGTAAQLEYRPFAHPRRAASEEFGDLIAEGLFRLIHQGAGIGDATGGYWREALARRARLIDDIAAQLFRSGANATLVGSALMSLAAARKRLGMISTLACVSFVHAWQADLDAWRRTLNDLPELGALADAAKYLRLLDSESSVVR